MNSFSPERAFQVPDNATRQARSWFRTGALILGAILALQACWVLVPQILGTTLPYFPTTPSEARAMAAHHSRAALAAHIGWPRGDLWIDNALSLNAAALSAFESGNPSHAPTISTKAHTVDETAAALAPADARAWLLLAMASTQAHNGKALAQLKMSYYTLPYSGKLFPLRIQIAAQLPAIKDREIQGFLRYELKLIIHNRPDLEQSIVSAFRSATPGARQFLKVALATVDPKLLARLQP